jgi:hypothetical protein
VEHLTEEGGEAGTVDPVKPRRSEVEEKAMAKVSLLHREMRVRKEVKWGFSWTTLVFGPFVPLVRADLKWALLMVVAAPLTAGITWLLCPFFYNRFYVHDLLKRGYLPDDTWSRQVIRESGLLP